MKKLNRLFCVLFALLLCFAVFVSCGSSDVTGGSFYADNIADFRSEKLTNGIPVYFKQNRGSRVVVVRMVFEGGVPLYESKIDGIEDFAFELAFHGSENFSYENLQQLQYEKSFSISSTSGKDYTTAGFTCINRDLDLVTEIFADALLKPLMNQDDFQQLYTEALQSITSKKADPSGVLGIELSKLAFENHPYLTSAQLKDDTIGLLTPELVKKHFASLLNASRIKLVVVADMTVEQTKEFTGKLNSYFGSLEKMPYEAPVIPVFNPSGKTSYAANPQAGESGYIAGIFDCPDRKSDEYIPFAIATMYLDDMLFDQVREKGGAVYSIGTMVIGGKHLLGGISAYKANNSKNLKELIENAVNSFDEKSAGEKLEQYKNKYITTLFNSSQNASGIAGNMVSSLEIFGSETAYLKRDQMVKNVKKEQVVNAYNKYIKKAVQNSSWTVVSSEENLKTFGF